ncbi:MAG: glucosyl-3-phosphoglycerate synthase [Actinomycetota bacterium]|nr:MAG: glucosyl-3-phosphoglycerate synthase [Actinomycetota bacterium]
MREDAAAWFARRTSRAQDWPAELVRRSKGSTRVSVVLPALNEQETVGVIVAAIRDHLMAAPSGAGRSTGPDSVPLVDDLVVLDSGSSDATAAVAAAAGARVVHRDDVLARIPAVRGKGEAMWRAVAATDGDIVVFVDADLRSFTPAYITGLLGPLLTDPSVALVKAMYERPLVSPGGTVTAGGGRVTELVARPLLNLHWPHLSGVAQPLAGEYAARRSLLEVLPFPCGYGVEFALLVDAAEVLGLDALAQVDLGVRMHRHHDEPRLGRMAAEIWRTALARLDPDGRLGRPGDGLAQFERGPGGLIVVDHEVSALERPPLLEIAEYAGDHDSARS